MTISRDWLAASVWNTVRSPVPQVTFLIVTLPSVIIVSIDMPLGNYFASLHRRP